MPAPVVAWRVDATGQCQAAPCPAHTDLLRLLDALQLDHVLWHPPDAEPTAARVYVSLRRPGACVVPGDGGAPGTAELAALYRWAMQERHARAHPCVRLPVLPHTPNVSHSTADGIRAWCDGHIDAFTRYRCKELLRRSPQVAPPPPKRPRHA